MVKRWFLISSLCLTHPRGPPPLPMTPPPHSSPLLHLLQGAPDPPAAREQDAEAGTGWLGQPEDRAAAEPAGGRRAQGQRAGDGEQVMGRRWRG